MYIISNQLDMGSGRDKEFGKSGIEVCFSVCLGCQVDVGVMKEQERIKRGLNLGKGFFGYCCLCVFLQDNH